MGKLSDWKNAVSDSISINRSLAAAERAKYLLPFLFASALFLFDFFCIHCHFRLDSFASSLVLMSAFLLLLPPDFEPVTLSVVLTAFTLLVCSIPLWLCVAGHKTAEYYAPVICMVSPSVLVLQLTIRSYDRYSGVNFLSRDINILHNREDFLRICHTEVVTLLSCIILYSIILGGQFGTLACSVSAIAALVLFIILEVRARIGQTYCTDKVPAARLSQDAPMDREPAGMQPPGNKDRLLYDRVETYMKDHQPYLEDGFSLTELAAMMYTNKSYLSRTINRYSGYNFCQYVNKYRVEYAKEMMQKDRRIKILELAMASGFHSVASFNMAFKLHTNDTPSEYMRTVHLCDGY